MSNSDAIAAHNQAHYDSVTDAWNFILGDNLHYGAFSADTSDLAEATDRLIWEMASFGELKPGMNILDVGCGIGNPAFLLREKLDCMITGITISERGVEIGNQRAEQRGLSQAIRFVQADALANGMADESFDFLWQMESSHLMHDKIGLFQENFRVLRPGGSIVLCDLILKRDLSVTDIYNLRDELATLESAFGKAKMATVPFYHECMTAAGFQAIESLDISDSVKPTLRAWKENVALNLERIEALLEPQAIDDFLKTCDILEQFFDQNLLGYSLIRAHKNVQVSE
jgi:27-O-demethylrifamycin SV methyltransferase